MIAEWDNHLIYIYEMTLYNTRISIDLYNNLTLKDISRYIYVNIKEFCRRRRRFFWRKKKQIIITIIKDYIYKYTYKVVYVLYYILAHIAEWTGSRAVRPAFGIPFDVRHHISKYMSLDRCPARQ